MSKCLLIRSSANILGAGVESLLSSIGDLDLISISSPDGAKLKEAIQQYQAEIVIIEGNQWMNETYLTGLLMTRPGLLVIKIDADDNRLHIYRHHQLSIHNTSDLIGLIEGD